MNAAVSRFSGAELLYLALYDLQIDDEYLEAEREYRRQHWKKYYQKNKAKILAKQHEYQRRRRQERKDST